MAEDQEKKQEVQLIELDAAFDGTAYMEGAKPSAVKELWENMSEYEKIKQERMKLNKKESELKSDHPRLYKKYKEFFVTDDKESNLFHYDIGGLSMDVKITEELEIKTHPTPAAPPISTASQNVNEIAPLKKGGKKKVKPEDSPDEIY